MSAELTLAGEHERKTCRPHNVGQQGQEDDETKYIDVDTPNQTYGNSKIESNGSEYTKRALNCLQLTSKFICKRLQLFMLSPVLNKS